jgi:hypothetical protein
VRRLLRVEAASILPPRSRVLVRAGVPEGRTPSVRVLGLHAKAVELFLAEADPVAVVEEVSLGELLGICRDPRPGPPSVVETVAPRARRLALFAATVGEPVCARIRTLFAEGDAPLGLLLDAVASEAATELAEELGEAYADDGLSVLGYSPGYCGWPLAGQRELFARLRPSDAGIALSDRALMSPVKSVSGVLVAAPPGAHRFRPGFDFCEACAERTCLERMASLPAGEGGTPWIS